jgi:hypothetical protein
MKNVLGFICGVVEDITNQVRAQMMELDLTLYKDIQSHIEQLRSQGKIPTGKIQLIPRWKKNYAKMLKDYIKMMKTYITAIIGKNVTIEDDVSIGPYCLIGMPPEWKGKEERSRVY